MFMSNGTISNGSISNGSISNGSISNGTISNGSIYKWLTGLVRNSSLNASSPSCWDNPKDFNISKISSKRDLELIIKCLNDKHYQELQGNENSLIATVVFCYALIIIVSLFGNLIVCKIVFTGPGKKSTTNLYIGNLSISDLMMTIIEIPLQLTDVLIRNWPLGSFLCKCLHLFRGMSVATSTLTMAFIALDRYQVIAHPLKPRPSYKTTIRKIVFIWITAFIVSFPDALMSQAIIRFTYDYLTRCTIIYPSPGVFYRQVFTLIALALKFAGPLIVSIITYVKICLIIWKRRSIGAVVVNREIYQREAKWKTIKMLVIVLITFVVCWLPLNIYHNYQDALREKNYEKRKPAVLLVCHWFAMSSVCCNPFIYCWLNDKFRNLAKSHLQWILTCRRTRSQEPILHFRVTASTNTNSSSLRYSASSSPSKEFPTVGSEKQLSENHEISEKTLHHATITEITEYTTCRVKQYPKQSDLITKYYFFQEKRYKNSIVPESFV